ncbi:MAG: hypothetical protein KKA19_05400 [Candidatus Margulisbacteria bacterium]|nr:hypothetical protein [Candidatus Margulisiibacteriota bacterium]
MPPANIKKKDIFSAEIITEMLKENKLMAFLFKYCELIKISRVINDPKQLIAIYKNDQIPLANRLELFDLLIPQQKLLVETINELKSPEFYKSFTKNILYRELLAGIISAKEFKDFDSIITAKAEELIVKTLNNTQITEFLNHCTQENKYSFAARLIRIILKKKALPLAYLELILSSPDSITPILKEMDDTDLALIFKTIYEKKGESLLGFFKQYRDLLKTKYDSIKELIKDNKNYTALNTYLADLEKNLKKELFD